MDNSSVMQKRAIFFSNPEMEINISSKERKEILLSQEDKITVAGRMRQIKFTNLGSGVWKMYCEVINK